MKIQLITRHYWPDSTPGARLHRAILEHLAGEGHDIQVYTAQPSYNDLDHDSAARSEQMNGVRIRRIFLLPERKRWLVVRALNLIYFLSRAFWNACRSDSNLLIVSSYPPVVAGILGWLVHKIRGVPYLYHCLDIQPESAALVGKLKSTRLTNLLKRWDRRTCENAAAVVTLSEEMAQTLRSRGWSGNTIRLINNFHTEPLTVNNDGEVPGKAPLNDKRRAFQVVFAGNMGSFQGLEVLIEAAGYLRDREDIQFVLMGAGERKEALRRQAGKLNGKTVHFIPFQPVHVASEVVAGSDLAVVSLLPDVFATAIPSKTMMYLRAGCPVLALIEPTCELARLVKKHDLGVVPPARDPQKIAEAIFEAYESREKYSATERERLVDAGESLFGYAQTLDKWTRLINHLDAQSPPRLTRPAQRAA